MSDANWMADGAARANSCRWPSAFRQADQVGRPSSIFGEMDDILPTAIGALFLLLHSLSSPARSTRKRSTDSL
jgi:hypothetical protein